MLRTPPPPNWLHQHGVFQHGFGVPVPHPIFSVFDRPYNRDGHAHPTPSTLGRRSGSSSQDTSFSIRRRPPLYISLVPPLSHLKLINKKQIKHHFFKHEIFMKYINTFESFYFIYYNVNKNVFPWNYILRKSSLDCKSKLNYIFIKVSLWSTSNLLCGAKITTLLLFGTKC